MFLSHFLKIKGPVPIGILFNCLSSFHDSKGRTEEYFIVSLPKKLFDLFFNEIFNTVSFIALNSLTFLKIHDPGDANCLFNILLKLFTKSFEITFLVESFPKISDL